MVIAQPVTVDGVVLCGEGTALTARLIASLERREVAHVFVEGHPVGDEADAPSVAEQKKDLNRRFRRLAGDTFMMEIKAVFEEQLRQEQPEEPSSEGPPPEE